MTEALTAREGGATTPAQALRTAYDALKAIDDGKELRDPLDPGSTIVRDLHREEIGDLMTAALAAVKPTLDAMEAAPEGLALRTSARHRSAWRKLVASGHTFTAGSVEELLHDLEAALAALQAEAAKRKMADEAIDNLLEQRKTAQAEVSELRLKAQDVLRLLENLALPYTTDILAAGKVMSPVCSERDRAYVRMADVEAALEPIRSKLRALAPDARPVAVEGERAAIITWLRSAAQADRARFYERDAAMHDAAADALAHPVQSPAPQASAEPGVVAIYARALGAFQRSDWPGIEEALRAALASAGSGTVQSEQGWRTDMGTVPFDTPVEVQIGEGMTIIAKLMPNASENENGRSCHQWWAVHDGEHPPCWSEGACWSSNANETASLQPRAWRPTASGSAGTTGREASTARLRDCGCKTCGGSGRIPGFDEGGDPECPTCQGSGDAP